MRPLLAPDAYLRTYVSDRGWGRLLGRRVPAPRVELSALDVELVGLCDGQRGPEEIERAVEQALGRPVGRREVGDALARLREAGALIDGDEPGAGREPPRPGGLEVVRLDAAAAARMRLALAPGVGFACHGQGCCCRLHDLVTVEPVDVAALEEAYGAGGHLPGGLTVHSAISRPRPDDHDLALVLAAVDGACVVLQPDGRCGLHARLGRGRKPAGCRAFPLRDVLCGDELAVGVTPACRCVLDSSDGPGLQEEAEALLARRAADRLVEAVRGEVPSAVGRALPRASYLGWRAAAGGRLAAAGDPVEWALDEAARLAGSGAAPLLRGFLGAAGPVLEEIAGYLAFEALDTARVYPSVDLQRQLFAWAAATARRLADDAAAGRDPGAPAVGERLVCGQALHTHDFAGAPDLVTGLLSLAVRICLARSAAPEAPAAVLALSAFTYLDRSSGLGLILRDHRAPLATALARG